MICDLVNRLFRKQEPYVFVAMPLSVKEDYRGYLDDGLSALRESEHGVETERYFSSFEIFEEFPWLKKLEKPLRKKSWRELSKTTHSLRKVYEKFLIGLCKAKASSAEAVLYVVPGPYEVSRTITLGAVSECDRALRDNIPTFVYFHGEKQLVRVNSINEIFEMKDLRAPAYWLMKEPSLRIDQKFVDYSQEKS